MANYDNINDLIRALNLDKTHWINLESFRFTSKKIYDNTSVNLTHVPEAFLKKQTKCENNHIFSLNWLKKRHPISCFYCSKRGLLRQATVYVKCPKCHSKVSIELPLSQYKGSIEIYGDEAMREVDSKKIFVYSFISFSGNYQRKKQFENDFLSIKKELSPSFSPKEWVFHMTELFSSEKRNSSPYLKHLQFDEIRSGVLKILNLISKHNELGDLNIYSAISIVISNTLKNNGELAVKNNVYNSALMNIIQETTSNNLAPMFYFERTGNDGWAKNLFDGGRLTLLWAFITNGLPVKTPEFVPPSYSLFLEIADIVSYLVARFLFCIGKRAEGKESQPEFDLTLLGKIRYITTDGNGDWINNLSNGFPSQLIFKGTEWETYL